MRREIVMDLAKEANRASALLRGKVLEHLHRHRNGEVLIEFSDGSRLFVNSTAGLELSITLADQPGADG